MSNAPIIQSIVLNVLRDLISDRSLPRVELSELRAELDGGVTREAQDAALVALHDRGELILMRNDNTPALGTKDHDSAIHVAGNPRHLVWLTPKT